MREKAKVVEELVGGQREIMEFLGEQRDFVGVVDGAIEYLTLVLSSKTQIDTVETVRVFTLLHKYGIQSAKRAFSKLLPLVFSKDTRVREQVIDSYAYLYFGP